MLAVYIAILVAFYEFILFRKYEFSQIITVLIIILICINLLYILTGGKFSWMPWPYENTTNLECVVDAFDTPYHYI